MNGLFFVKITYDLHHFSYRQSKKEYEIEEKKRKTMEKEELANVMVLEQNRLQNEKVKEHKKYEQVKYFIYYY